MNEITGFYLLIHYVCSWEKHEDHGDYYYYCTYYDNPGLHEWCYNLNIINFFSTPIINTSTAELLIFSRYLPRSLAPRIVTSHFLLFLFSSTSRSFYTRSCRMCNAPPWLFPDCSIPMGQTHSLYHGTMFLCEYCVSKWLEHIPVLLCCSPSNMNKLSERGAKDFTGYTVFSNRKERVENFSSGLSWDTFRWLNPYIKPNRLYILDQ